MLRLVNENLETKDKTLISDLEKSNSQLYSFLSRSQKIDYLLKLNKNVWTVEGPGYK